MSHSNSHDLQIIKIQNGVAALNAKGKKSEIEPR
jgi:hypothetical protein